MTVSPVSSLQSSCCCRVCCFGGKTAQTCVLDLWLLCFSASYSTLAQFMMNYGNEWDMDLILAYVGTQIWGTVEHHVLLLTSRKSCLVTSRGKRVHRANAGWDVRGARASMRSWPGPTEPGTQRLELSRCAILRCSWRTARRGRRAGSPGG